MAGIQSSNTDSKGEACLRALYGDKLAKNRLLHKQLEERNFFDSGDYALSQAHKSTNIGKVETGIEHPARDIISHPESAVPATSNVLGVGSHANICNQRQSSTS